VTIFETLDNFLTWELHPRFRHAWQTIKCRILLLKILDKTLIKLRLGKKIRIEKQMKNVN